MDSEQNSAVDDEEDAPAPEPDARIHQVAMRAKAAGLAVWWTRFTNPATGRGEGPRGVQIDLRAGRKTRSIRLSGGDEAGALLQHPFERWTALGGYEAILDTHEHRIVAAVTLQGTSLGKIPGVTVEPPEDPEPISDSLPEFKTAAAFWGPQPGPSTLTIIDDNSSLTLQLRNRAPAEIQALHGSSSRHGYALTISGVTTDRHDDAVKLLEDLSTALFLDLDRGYGLTGTLDRTYNADNIEQEYDPENGSPLPPRMPSLHYDHDAAALYLYARSLTNRQMPVLEYLAYYQVIEHYMPKFTKQAAISRVRNLLRDPRFDPNDDVTLGRLIASAAPAGRTTPSERDQIFAVAEACLDDTTMNQFLTDRPATARALSDKKAITGVRLLQPSDKQTSLIRQTSDRIYDLRCRIVHSKDDHRPETKPLRPFGPDSKRLRHDLYLVRFVAQHVLIASSSAAHWR